MSEDDETDESASTLARGQVENPARATEAEAQPMPEELRNRVRVVTLRGFMATGMAPGGVDAICVARGILGAVFGFTLLQFFEAASTHLRVVANVVGVVLGLQGTIIASTNVRPLWQQLVVSWPTRKTSETSNPPQRGLTDSYLETLLSTPLSEARVAMVEEHWRAGTGARHAQLPVGFGTTLGVAMMGAAAIAAQSVDPGSSGASQLQSNDTADAAVEIESSDTVRTMTLIAGIVTAVVYAPIVGMQNRSVHLVKQFACLVVTDMADQITAQVRESTARTLDFDDITNKTHRLHL
jgi:hypothetical protein